MTGGDEEKTIRRILLAIDASPHSLAALNAAAELAALLDAELLGLFVEDINLLKLADLSFSRQVGFHSASARQFSRQQIEQELRAQANRAKKALAIASQKARVRSNFKVVRGMIVYELLQAAQEVDLVIVGKASWSRSRGLGSTTRTLIAHSPCQTLIIQQGSRLGMVMGLLYDGSDLSKKALIAAEALLKQRSGFLTVIILAEDIEKARDLQTEVTIWLREHQLASRFRWLLTTAGGNLTGLVKAEQIGVLLIPAGFGSGSPNEVSQLLNELDTPVFLIR
jgi:nucleotide-binding universal stress UspA family protein